MNNSPQSSNNPDAQTLLNEIVLNYLKEKKSQKFWRWLKRGLIAIILMVLMFQFAAAFIEENALHNTPHVGVIDIQGTIADAQEGSADNLAKALSKAYENKQLKALVLRIDSPGGSPVQADYMFNAIKYYRGKYKDIKVYAVCVDMCASAAYYVAASADEIYANPASLVGSIGVLYNGFGFVDTMQKVGVSRRLLTAGRYKGFMDQFSPVQPEQEKIMHTMLNDIHQLFIARVKEGRGPRLKIDDDTFSGLFWTGTQAKSRGLIDGFASTGQLARDIIKVERLVDYTYAPNMLEKVSKNIGTAIANQLPSALGLKSKIE